MALAIEADNAQDYEKAFGLYQRALEIFMVALKWEKNPKSKEIIQARVVTYMDRAELLRKTLKEKESAPAPSAKKKAAAATGGAEEEDNKLRGALSSAIVVEKPNITWDAVAGLEGAKETLKEAVILPQKFPQLFTGERRPWSGILLYAFARPPLLPSQRRAG